MNKGVPDSVEFPNTVVNDLLDHIIPEIGSAGLDQGLNFLEDFVTLRFDVENGKFEKVCVRSRLTIFTSSIERRK